MSSTTTIRLTEDLKQRVTQISQRGSTTAHGFILEAITEKVEREERRAAFDGEACARLAKLVENGESIPWDDMKRHLAARLAGTDATPPVPRKLR
ncbi:CopG family ribbon-helix-helix protein [Pseudazoarcus pumilus]|uniref:CopG family transcriptional regulator n=1 Tax=Pseudazoarcus pumilus TaxID=2067960 RepID=A0A2I6SAS0_9RHOO|nr:CopG family transcriptional regulator [Pseudazoarcus pumilus]AUN96356.1 CopG family transcriptional regulator [Pseudazoarcus pumilus]